MLKYIKSKFDEYKKIYQLELPKIKDSQTKILLSNSLYLSVYTVFEGFLKELIENYIDGVVNEKRKYIDLSMYILYLMFISYKSRIDRIYEKKDSDEKKSFEAFESFYNLFNKPIEKDEIKKYIHFEFLHLDNLKKYYNYLFVQLLGEFDCLKNIKINRSSLNFGNSLEECITEDAFSFVSKYTDKIRNQIAHSNDIFNNNYDINYFIETVDNFYLIINQICVKYTKNTGFKLVKSSNNVLQSF